MMIFGMAASVAALVAGGGQKHGEGQTTPVPPPQIVVPVPAPAPPAPPPSPRDGADNPILFAVKPGANAAWKMDKPLAAHLSFAIAPNGRVSNCVLDAVGTPTGPAPICPELAKAHGPVIDYLRAGSKVPVTIAADFTVGLEGAPPLPPYAPKPGVVGFARLNIDAVANPAGGRSRCVVDGSWGEYKARLEFPCPRETQTVLTGNVRALHIEMTLGSSGPAPDPEGLGPLIALLNAKHSPPAPPLVIPAPAPVPAPPKPSH